MAQSDLVAGIAKHIALGDSKEVIANHVRNAGYSNRDFESAYLEALAKSKPVTNSTETESATVVPQSSHTENNPPTTPHPSSQVPVSSATASVTIFSPLLISLVLGGIFIVAGVLAWFFGAPLSLMGLFGGAPYNEDTFTQDVFAGITKISASDFTLEFSATAAAVDEDVYVLPAHIDKALEYPFVGLSVLPTDFTVGGAIAGTFSLDDKKSDSYTKMSGFYETPDLTMNIDAELLLSQMEGVFLKVNRFPSIMMLDFSPVREEWLHIWEEPLDDTFGDWADSQEDKENTAEQLTLLLQYADKYKIFTTTADPVKEKINGETAYKYTLVLNADGLAEYLKTSKTEFDTRYGSRDHVFSDLTEEILELYSDKEFMEYIATHSVYELWARPNGVPIQFSIKNRIAIDSSVSYMDMYSNTDVFAKSFLANLRAEAEIYAFDAGGYEGFCTKVSELSYLDNEYICNDSDTGFAVAMELKESYWCVDYTGFSGEKSIQGSDLVCSDAPKKQPVATQTPVPDRQINTTAIFTFNNINNPSLVVIPQNVISRDELIKKVPLLSYLLPAASE